MRLDDELQEYWDRGQQSGERFGYRLGVVVKPVLKVVRAALVTLGAIFLFGLLVQAVMR
jgi:hypothetical protein